MRSAGLKEMARREDGEFIPISSLEQPSQPAVATNHFILPIMVKLPKSQEIIVEMVC
jgi:hypothetical protein